MWKTLRKDGIQQYYTGVGYHEQCTHGDKVGGRRYQPLVVGSAAVGALRELIEKIKASNQICKWKFKQYL